MSTRETYELALLKIIACDTGMPQPQPETLEEAIALGEFYAGYIVGQYRAMGVPPSDVAQFMLGRISEVESDGCRD